MRARWMVWFIVLLLAGLSVSPLLAAQQSQQTFPQDECQYFSSGHYICGPFLEFFNAHGGLATFGYPETEVFQEIRLGGRWVQYFDNARMEWHPENPPPYEVQLGLLGEEMGYRQPPVPREQWPANGRLHRVFPETGHIVSYAFLDLFNRRGGLDVFGYPISEPLSEGPYLVQYFQRMRMEWRPERPPDDRVTVGSLGLEAIYRFNIPPEVRMRQPAPPIISPGRTVATPVARSLRLSAAVRYALASPGNPQTVYVYVTDEQRQPVSGAHPTIVVHYANQDVAYALPETDARGTSQVSFPLQPSPMGRRVIVEVQVEHQGITATTSTSFRPWW